MKQPYVYLRKSRVMRGAEIISPEMQLAACREYAGQWGDTGLVVLTDMNKSGRKGRRDRPGFHALLTAIESGVVSAVYSYSLSRLSRSVRDIMALADLCRSYSVATDWRGTPTPTPRRRRGGRCWPCSASWPSSKRISPANGRSMPSRSDVPEATAWAGQCTRTLTW